MMTLEHKLRILCSHLKGESRTARMVELLKEPKKLNYRLAVRFAIMKGKRK